MKKLSLKNLKAQEAKPVPETSSVILLVDDEPANLRSLERVLVDYTTISASDGYEALEKIQSHPEPEKIHLIISDQRMPQMSGVEFLEQTRNVIPETIRILLTGYTDVNDIIASINQGRIYQFLTKPIEPESLVVTVRRALESYQRRKENRNLLSQLQSIHQDLEARVRERVDELEVEIQKRKAAERRLRQALEISERNRFEMEKNLDDAREVQSRMVHSLPTGLEGVNIAARHLPFENVGGDIYQVSCLDDAQLAIMMGDVTGHGVAAGLITFMVGTIFSEARNMGDSIELVLNLTNARLERYLPMGRYASAFYGILNIPERKLRFVNAGHPPIYILRVRSRQVFALSTQGLLLGMFPTLQNVYAELTFDLEIGDKVLVFTDGLIEVQGPDQDYFFNRIEAFLYDHLKDPLDFLLDQTIRAARQFGGGVPFDDDVTLLGVELT